MKIVIETEHIGDMFKAYGTINDGIPFVTTKRATEKQAFNAAVTEIRDCFEPVTPTQDSPPSEG